MRVRMQSYGKSNRNQIHTIDLHWRQNIALRIIWDSCGYEMYFHLIKPLPLYCLWKWRHSYYFTKEIVPNSCVVVGFTSQKNHPHRKFFVLVCELSLTLLSIAKTAIVCFKLCNYAWCYPHPWLYKSLVFSSNFMSRSLLLLLLCISLPRWSACMMWYTPLVLSDNKRPQANVSVYVCMCLWWWWCVYVWMIKK